MYKKLITNLPFQPSLIGDVALAAKRAKRDRIIYSVSLVVLLVLLLVFFLSYRSTATLSHHQSYALTPFGFLDKQDVAATCQDNNSDYAAALRELTITCDEIERAQKTTFAEAVKNINQANLTIVNRANNPDKTNDNIALNEHIDVRLSSSNTRESGQDGTSRVLVGSHAANETFILFLSGESIATTKDKNAHLRSRVLATQTNHETTPLYCTSSYDQQCLQRRHRVVNETQSIANAAGHSANIGDVLRYEFIVTNNTNESQAITIANGSEAILSQALVINLHGGSIDENRAISWPTKAVDPGEAVTQSLTVEVKARSSQLSEHSIKNTFGNTTSVPLRSGLTRTIVANMQSDSPLSFRVIAITMTALITLTLMLLLYSYTIESELTTVLNAHKNGGPSL